MVRAIISSLTQALSVRIWPPSWTLKEGTILRRWGPIQGGGQPAATWSQQAQEWAQKDMQAGVVPDVHPDPEPGQAQPPVERDPAGDKGTAKVLK